MKYIIGTRGSKLALVQTNYVCDTLKKAYPQHEFEIVVIKTKGDLILDKPLNQIGDKGLFVKEIEEKMRSGEIHMGVHSMKDMPAVPAPGLVFTKAWKREDPRDVLILREKKNLMELKMGAVIGTGSRRRTVQLLRMRPDLKIVDIRGNVETRIRKMEEQKLDGIVLAAAGLHRLGMQERITQYLESEEMISAPAQGILALEIREEETELAAMLNALSDEETEQIAIAERGFLQLIGGDCHVPVGAVCKCTQTGTYRLKAMFGRAEEEAAYIEVEGAEPLELAKEAAKGIRRQLAGTVYLVGGGPGDAELITVKGRRLLSEADCIIYDRLSSPELLAFAKADCEKIYVGKADRHHTMKQEDINSLLVEKAMKYQKVVRLKGGDVYVFGRGGEEGLVLRENGVPFEIVPGISSSMAGLAYAGIPVTHRGISSGFHVVTAHDRQDELADIDFEAMARGKDTCVFLMGLGKVGEIAEKLMQAGKPETTAAAVISRATTPGQKVCCADLAHIAEETKKAALPSPALIVVGDVIALREQLSFFEQKVLFGKSYLIPKIGEPTTELAQMLREKGASVEEFPVGQIVHKKADISREDLAGTNWLLFTSKHGVDAFFENLDASGLDVRNLAGISIAAIGSKTAEHLRAYGIHADFVPEVYNSDAFAEELQKLVKPEERILYPKAANADSHLKEALGQYCRFDELVVYENEKAENIILPEIWTNYDGILFTCASSAKRFAKAVRDMTAEYDKKECRIYSIGPKCSQALRELGFETVEQAKEATYRSMAEMIIEKQK